MQLLLLLQSLAASFLLNENLITVAQSLDYSELVSLSQTNKVIHEQLKPIFETTRVCPGLKNNSMLWPTLHLDSSVGVAIPCLAHLKEYSYFFPRIQIIGGITMTRNVIQNVLACINSSMTVIELVFKFWIEPEQLEMILASAASRKLSLILQNIEWNNDYARVVSSFLMNPNRNLIELVITEPIDKPYTRHVFDPIFSNISNSKLSLFKFEKEIYNQPLPFICDSLVNGIQSSSLNVFHLHGCDFKTESLEVLAASLPSSLRELKLTFMQFRNSLIPSPLLESLFSAPRALKTLDLVDFSFGFTSVGLTALSSLLSSSSHLKSLGLINCNLGPAGLRSVIQSLPLSTLTSLNLNSSLFDQALLDDSIEAIGNIKTLQTLNLASNHLGYDGAVLIESMLKESGITTLVLQKNEIETFGAFKIANGIKGSSILELDLSFNEIFKSGAEKLNNTVNANGNSIRVDLDENPTQDDPGYILRSLAFLYRF